MTQRYQAPFAAGKLAVLAFKDGKVIEAEDYWLQGGQLCYLSAAGVQGSIPADRLDVPKTLQLNQERHMTFALETRS